MCEERYFSALASEEGEDRVEGMAEFPHEVGGGDGGAATDACPAVDQHVGVFPGGIDELEGLLEVVAQGEPFAVQGGELQVRADVTVGVLNGGLSRHTHDRMDLGC